MERYIDKFIKNGRLVPFSVNESNVNESIIKDGKLLYNGIISAIEKSGIDIKKGLSVPSAEATALDNAAFAILGDTFESYVVTLAVEVMATIINQTRKLPTFQAFKTDMEEEGFKVNEEEINTNEVAGGEMTIVDHKAKKFIVLTDSSWKPFVDHIAAIRGVIEGTGTGDITIMPLDKAKLIKDGYKQVKNMAVSVELLK